MLEQKQCEECGLKLAKGSTAAAARWCGSLCFSTSEDGQNLARTLRQRHSYIAARGHEIFRANIMQLPERNK